MDRGRRALQNSGIILPTLGDRNARKTALRTDLEKRHALLQDHDATSRPTRMTCSADTKREGRSRMIYGFVRQENVFQGCFDRLTYGDLDMLPRDDLTLDSRERAPADESRPRRKEHLTCKTKNGGGGMRKTAVEGREQTKALETNMLHGCQRRESSRFSERERLRTAVVDTTDI